MQNRKPNNLLYILLPLPSPLHRSPLPPAQYATLSSRVVSDPKWANMDPSKLYPPTTTTSSDDPSASSDSLQTLLDELIAKKDIVFTLDTSPPPKCDFPAFGGNSLQPAALKHLCGTLHSHLRKAVVPVSDIPAVMIIERRNAIWRLIRQACGNVFFTDQFLSHAAESLRAEDIEESPETKTVTKQTVESHEKLSGNEVLIEVGVKTGLSIVFSLLRQTWSQLAWQKQFEAHLLQSGALTPAPPPVINLPNEVLRSVLDVLKHIQPLSLTNLKALSKLSQLCLTQSTEFLESVLLPDSCVDTEGKRLALEISLSLVLQQGSLVSLLLWVEKGLNCLAKYGGGDPAQSVATPTLSLAFCQYVVEEIRKRTVSCITHVLVGLCKCTVEYSLECPLTEVQLYLYNCVIHTTVQST